MHYNKDTHNDIARTMQTMRDDYIGREQRTGIKRPHKHELREERANTYIDR